MTQTKKVELYSEFIGVVMDMLASSKLNQGKVKAMAIKLQRIGLNMMVIASDDVVEKFIKWRAMAMAADSTTAETIIEAYFYYEERNCFLRSQTYHQERG